MCNCIEENDKALEDLNRNTKLDIPFRFSQTNGTMKANRVKIATCKIDEKNRQKPITLLASYCPFCGEKYEDT